MAVLSILWVLLVVQTMVAAKLKPDPNVRFIPVGKTNDFQQPNGNAEFERSYQELVARENERGLFPNIFNLATNAIITANATCGTSRPEDYCKLMEHVFMRQPQCDVCDANNMAKRHPIEFAIDGTNDWWQSPSLASGLQNELVTITLDLRQQYQVAYVIIKSGIAPRPATWVLERSLDNITYVPWQYFAASDAECQSAWGSPAVKGHHHFESDDEVTCTSQHSKLNPFENGEIHISLVNDRPGISGPSEALQNFTRARYIRLRFRKLRTLNADLIYINRRENGQIHRIDQSVTRRYFYAIKDISVGGQCICYGHAESCPVDPGSGQLRCECKHNTCGESCEECCPLFNQFQWQPGTNNEPHICQPCQCFGHADECLYDKNIANDGLSVTPDGLYEGGGKCTDCKHNTKGVNCEACTDLHYRPSGISHYREDACRPCDCDETGSVDGECIKDDTLATDKLRPGDCVCKPGFGGRRCEKCAPGFRNYPECEPCPCNQAGSANFETCEDTCVCKPNVEGLYCDRCKQGFINLDASNPDGCQPCFCFGITDQCEEVAWGKSKIRDLKNWNLTGINGARSVRPTHESGTSLTFNTHEINDPGLYYWKAPKAYTGNLIKNYGGLLQYYVYYVPERDGPTVPLADVILEGNGVKLEYHSRQQFFERENVSVSVRLRETSGWYEAESRQPVTKRQLMRCLADLRLFLVRALYHQHQIQASLYGVTIESATNNTDLEQKMTSVERCRCPDDFTGTSCEQCKSGFRRVNNALYKGSCSRCECNGHSSRCDAYTGACIDCEHETTGDSCQHCRTGFFGNPLLGGDAGACTACHCPTLENQFSPTCSLASLVGAGGDTDFICTACQPGYVGNKCEMCADGYFGDPTVVNGTCEECQCSGNVDLYAVGNCDRKTGVCLKCTHNTEGDHCERCKPNHYGNALTHDCRSCGCSVFGAVNQQCNNGTGDCECKEGYVGVQCDRCMEGHGDVEGGCPECGCNMTGAEGHRCDPQSGQCLCRYGVFGKHCDQCKTGYFNFGKSGCIFCGCDEYGSVDGGSCDPVNGQCICRQHVAGKTCTECESGYFNITTGTGCHECGCDSKGATTDDSGNAPCELISGQCNCKIGVTGLKCDKCAPNFYGLTDEGCKQCPDCPAPGHVCDSETGECVCPPHTIGDMCEECAENTWNYDPLKGCERCDCDSVGSTGLSCDQATGQCFCEKGYTGLACDHCTLGHFNFPKCEKCNCSSAGTRTKSCNQGVCECDNDGQCPCKENVKETKCDVCDAKSFALQTDLPEGCHKCFCFNRTDFCVQSSYVWQQQFANSRTAFFMEPWTPYHEERGMHVLPDEPLTVNSFPPNDRTPLYWSLPKRWLGDRLSSYNGMLRFRITNRRNRDHLAARPMLPDAQLFNYYPLVVLIGNHRIRLEHYPKRIPENGRYKVQLREHEWRNQMSPDLPVSRLTMMVALQRVQAVYVRATFNHDLAEAALDDVSLDVAVWDNSTALINVSASAVAAQPPAKAIGVEECECKQGYAGMSCQNPAPGYFRKRIPNYLDSENDLILIGESVPCACYAHSTTCDAESGLCLNCQHNTTGDFCEKCGAGYYGNARQGTPEDCRQCACPLVGNSFSTTCYATSAVPRGYQCDNCKQGYTGMYCESCVDGYFGNPGEAGGSCNACDCHYHGALHGRCDRTTGQCECRPGVAGRDCSQCQPRHALVGALCTSCDQGCSRELMIDVDGLENAVGMVNVSGLVPVPWKRLSRVEQRIKNQKDRVKMIDEGEKNAGELLKGIDKAGSHSEAALLVFGLAKFMLEKITGANANVDKHIDDAETTSAKMQEARRLMHDTVEQLKQYVRQGGKDRTSVEIDSRVDGAKKLLKEIKERDEFIAKRFNRADVEHKEAKKLAEKVASMKYNDTSLEHLVERIRAFHEAVTKSYVLVYDDARNKLESTKGLNKTIIKSIERYHSVIDEAKNLAANTTDNLVEAENIVHGAQNELLLDTYDAFRVMNLTLIDLVSNATERCAATSRHLGDLLGTYRQRYVVPAELNATRLTDMADRLKRQFKSTKDASELAIRASSAYDDIVKQLETAKSAAELAKQSADNTYEKAYPADEGNSLVGVAANWKNTSIELLADAGALNTTALDKMRRGYVITLGDINEEVIRGVKSVDEIRKKLDTFVDHNSALNIAATQAQQALNQTKKLETEMQTLATNVDKMDKTVSRIKDSTGKGIRDVIDNVRRAADDVAKATEQLDKVREQADKNERRVDDLSRKVAALQEKIKEARERASKIKVSVKSPEGGAAGQCHRSFVSPVHPTAANSIRVLYRPLTERVDDSLLFITNTKRTRTRPSEHLALELKDRRFVFHWNVGGGDQMVTVTNNLIYIPPKAADTWYQVVINRRGKGAMLEVSQVKISNIGHVSSVGDPASQEVKGVGDSTIFNTVPTRTLISIGTDLSADELPKTIKTTEFRGTIGSLNIDGAELPLWGFASTSNNCEGAIKPKRKVPRGWMFRNGYAEMPSSPFRGSVESHTTAAFAAYSRDGLIYFRGNEEDGDFLSIQLRDGHVVFQYYLGGQSLGVIETKGDYADGQIYSVEAERNRTEAVLTILSQSGDIIETVANETSGDYTGLEIANTNLYLGGVPLTFNKTKFWAFNVRWFGFFGCIFDLQPERRSVNILTRTPQRTLNVKPGCPLDDGTHLSTSEERVVSFSPESDTRKSSYFVLDGVRLGINSSSLGFGFRTESANAMLLYQSDSVQPRYLRQRNKRQTAAEDGEQLGFIVAYLHDGYLVVTIGADAQDRDKLVTLRSDGKMYNDTYLHSVLIWRDGYTVRLVVDDRQAEENSDFRVDTPIGSSELRLFLGGVPPDVTTNAEEMPDDTPPMRGCISDLYNDFKRVQLKPKEHRLTQIGSCNMRAAEPVEGTQAEEPLQADDGGRTALRTSAKLRFLNQAPPTAHSRVLLDAAAIGSHQRHPGVNGNNGGSGVRTTTFSPPITGDPSFVCGPPQQREPMSPSAVRFGVTSGSHSKILFPKPYPSDFSFTMSFSFKTLQKDGLLMYWAAYKSNKRSYDLRISNGDIHLTVKKVDNLFHATIERQQLNDGKWHTLQVIKRRREVTLQVDDETVLEKKFPVDVGVVCKRLYVGGILSKWRKKHNETFPNFNGCIKNFVINGTDYDLMANPKNLYRCYEPVGSTFVDIGGYLTFGAPQYASKQLRLEMEFRTANSTGRLLTIASAKSIQTTRLTADLEDSRLVVRILIDGASVAEMRESVSVCDGDWHHLLIALDGDVAQMQVGAGGLTAAQPFADALGAINALRSLPVHVGGLAQSVMEREGGGALLQLRGCFRMLQTPTQLIEIDSAKRAHRTVFGGCPYTE